jgi:anti-anti-sigma factor
MSVLYVAGEVDDTVAPGLRSQLACSSADPPRDVVVDLSRVTFMSCAGLRPLIDAQARLGEHLWLRRVPRPVTRLLDLTHLRATFQVLEDRISGDDDSGAFMGLEAQVVGMQAAMRNRAVIEQAKGVLMDAHHCDAQHALDLLRQVSRDRKVEVGDLAAAVTRTADGADEGTSGVALRAALQEALFPAQAVDGGSGKYTSSLMQPLA